MAAFYRRLRFDTLESRLALAADVANPVLVSDSPGDAGSVTDWPATGLVIVVEKSYICSPNDWGKSVGGFIAPRPRWLNDQNRSADLLPVVAPEVPVSTEPAGQVLDEPLKIGGPLKLVENNPQAVAILDEFFPGWREITTEAFPEPWPDAVTREEIDDPNSDFNRRVAADLKLHAEVFGEPLSEGVC